jgi:hypothetical protein
MAQASNTIFLKGDGEFIEGNALAAISPGHFLRRTGVVDQLAVQATAAADVKPIVALEYDIIGRGIDKNYAANERVLAVIPRKGSWIYALVAAGAAAVGIGAGLEYAADGTLRILAAGKRIATALEAVDNSGGGTPARIRVEID